MTELIRSFTQFYNQTFVGLPTSKLVLSAMINFCLLKIILLLSDQKFTTAYYLPLIINIVWMLAATYLVQSPLQVFLFYLPNQLFLFYCGCLAILKSSRTLDQNKLYDFYLKGMGIICLIFAISIALEDFIVIFYIDHYSSLNLKIQNRNFNEDLFSITYATTFSYSLLKNLRLKFNNQTITVDLMKETTAAFKNFCCSYDLTARESEILQLLLKHKNNQEIADTLYLSVGTVKTHTHNIYIKLNINKREELFNLYQEYSAAF